MYEGGPVVFPSDGFLAIQEPEFTSPGDGLTAGGGQVPVGQHHLCPDSGGRHEHPAARPAPAAGLRLVASRPGPQRL